MKNKTLMFLACGVCSISCLAVSALAFKNNDSNFVSLTNADNEPYVLTINSSLYDGGDTSGVDYTYVQTANGNNVKIKYNKLAPFQYGGHSQYTTGFNNMVHGSYIEIVANDDDRIYGLAGISNVSFKVAVGGNSVDLRVSYGWDSGEMMNYEEMTITPFDETGEASFDLEYNPTYLKIETLRDDVPFDFGLNEIKITYSCSTSDNPFGFYKNYQLFKRNGYYEITGYYGDSTSLYDMPTEFKGLPVTKIADYFKVKNGMDSLTSVTLSSSITTIGVRAFFWATNLEFINLDNVTRIEEDAFYKNTSLAKQSYSELNMSNVTYIGSNAFGDSNLSMESIEFTAPSVTLASDVFNGCHVREVLFNSDVVLDVYASFRNCPDLIKVYLPIRLKDNRLWGKTFENCPDLYTFKYHGSTDQWNNIIKMSEWYSNIAATYVTCDIGGNVNF